jgi:hypothetical protein
MAAEIKLNVHGTEESLWKALSRLFEVQQGETSQWVELNVDGTRLTFFGPSIEGEESTGG